MYYDKKAAAVVHYARANFDLSAGGIGRSVNSREHLVERTGSSDAAGCLQRRSVPSIHPLVHPHSTTITLTPNESIIMPTSAHPPRVLFVVVHFPFATWTTPCVDASTNAPYARRHLTRLMISFSTHAYVEEMYAPMSYIRTRPCPATVVSKTIDAEEKRRRRDAHNEHLGLIDSYGGQSSCSSARPSQNAAAVNKCHVCVNVAFLSLPLLRLLPA